MTSPKRPREVNQLAKSIVDLATADDEPTGESKKVVRARTAGRVGGPARANSLSNLRRSEIAKTAAQARWKKAGKVPTDG